MNRQRFPNRPRPNLLGTFLAFSLALLAPVRGEAASPSATPRKPNILLIYVDDLGYGDLGLTGGKRVPTPHIDSLARNGVNCTQGYSTAPVCSPARAAVLTGRYQQRFGFDFLSDGAAPEDRGGTRGLDLRETTIAQRLRDAGYATGMVGKWHVVDVPRATPTHLPNARGFDEFYGILTASLDIPNTKTFRNTEPVPPPPNHMEAFVAESLDFITRHRGAAWFLYLSTTAVHDPNFVPKEYAERLDREYPRPASRYLAMLAQLDDGVGRLLAHLRENGLEENTLVFFMSDNGGDNLACPADNGPCREGKFSLHEGGIRTPFLVQWKGRLPAGASMPHPVAQIDVAATALAAAGVPALPPGTLDGTNLIPHLDGSDAHPPHAALYWRAGVQYAIRSGDWKLVRASLFSSPQLYNLAEDPGETRDLAAVELARARALQLLWSRWDTHNETPRWVDERWSGLDILQRIRAERSAGRPAKPPTPKPASTPPLP
jgi:arylsulfatase A-like enzyme